MSQNFSLGDLVWAKMKGFPPWPGIIKEPPEEVKAPKSKPGIHCVYFFGSKNYGWIEESCIKLYESNKDEIKKSTKTSAFMAAVREIEEYMKNSHNEDEVLKKHRNGASPKKDESKSDYIERNSLQKEQKTPDSPKQSLSKNESPPEKEILSKKEKLKTKSLKRQSSGASTSEPKTKQKSISNSHYDIEIQDRSPSLDTQNGSFSFTPNHQTHVNYSTGSRPQIVNPDIPELPQFDVNCVSDIIKNKTITPSELTFGFLGTGLIGAGIIKNLVHTKHKVVIWNSSPDKSESFKKLGVEILQTPGDVVSASDITFCCVSDEKAAKNLVFGNCGVSSEMKPNKAYVEMSGIDPEASLDIFDQISSIGGKYLEVRFLGCRKEAEDGSLVVIAAGDSTIYRDCESCFQAMGIHSKYLGSEIGKAARFLSVLQLMVGVTMGAVAEALVLTDCMGIDKQDVLSVIELSRLFCPMILDKCSAIKDNNFTTNWSLNNLQKGIKLALNLADKFDQRLPLTATANEMFIRAKKLGYKQCDSAAVFLGAKI